MLVTGPITPAEAAAVRPAKPSNVYIVVNALIVRRLKGNSAVIRQDEIVDELVLCTGLARHQVFEMGWLDFEEDYGKAGWDVKYDKPGYNETGITTFTFTKAK